MGTRSGFVYPEHRWLITEPERPLDRSYLTTQEVFDPIWSHTTGTGLVVEATAAALIIIDFTNYPAARGHGPETSGGKTMDEAIGAGRVRVQICNALALALHSATLEIHDYSMGAFRITHEDLMHFRENGVANVNSLPFVAGAGYVMPRHRSGACTVEELVRACDLLDQVLEHADSRTLDLVELLNTSLVACRVHDFDLAVVGSWTVCEAVLSNALQKHALAEAERHTLRVNRERRKSWDALSAATASEILALAGVLPRTLDDQLRLTRTARNKWIHRGTRATALEASDALRLAADLLAHFGWPRFTLAPPLISFGFGV